MTYYDFAIPSEQDNRDYNVSQFIPGKDEIKDKQFILNLPNLDVIIDQGQIGACVAHSISTCKSILEYNATKKWIDFSPFYLYGDRRSSDFQNPGMRPREALNNVKYDGMWFRRDFDVRKEVPDLYSFVAKKKQERPDLVKQAEDYRICGYAKLTLDNDIKKALKNGMPVTAMWRLFPSFYKTKKDGKVLVPALDETKTGNHQMTIVGWTDSEWIVINSWGNSYAHDGMYYIPFEYSPLEAWSISDTIFPSKKKAKKIIATIGDKRIRIDGSYEVLDVPAMVINNRTYTPVRIISEALGASVDWQNDTQKIIIRSEEGIIQLQIGSPTIIVNGKASKMDVTPILLDSRTLVSIRFIAENLNCIVDWNDKKQQVTITTL